MKKILILTLILGISFQFTSCKDEKKKKIEVEKEVKNPLIG
jgi:hypothetical protein